jgi:hypothetical protein
MQACLCFVWYFGCRRVELTKHIASSRTHPPTHPSDHPSAHPPTYAPFPHLMTGDAKRALLWNRQLGANTNKEQVPRGGHLECGQRRDHSRHCKARLPCREFPMGNGYQPCRKAGSASGLSFPSLLVGAVGLALTLPGATMILTSHASLREKSNDGSNDRKQSVTQASVTACTAELASCTEWWKEIIHTASTAVLG